MYQNSCCLPAFAEVACTTQKAEHACSNCYTCPLSELWTWVTVHINAGGDNHIISFISDQCFGLIAAAKEDCKGIHRQTVRCLRQQCGHDFFVGSHEKKNYANYDSWKECPKERANHIKHIIWSLREFEVLKKKIFTTGVHRSLTRRKRVLTQKFSVCKISGALNAGT